MVWSIAWLAERLKVLGINWLKNSMLAWVADRIGLNLID
jgi:hypothetical protein